MFKSSAIYLANRDSRIHGQISLNVKRAKISSTNCVHPQCMARENLHLVSICVRYELMKEMRFYVSPRGLVCENHRIFRQWNATDIEDCELIPYTVSNIEDMVDLLRFKPKKLEYVQPGMHSMF